MVDDGHTSRYYSPGELGGGGIVTSVVKYAGMYYIATFDNGVCRLDPATGRIERFGNNILLETASFGRLAVSPTNELWMASNAGVFVYNVAKNELHNFDSRNSQLFDSYANSLLFDRHGRCWIGTHEGMCVYNPIDGMLRTQGFPENFKSNVPEPNFILALDNNILSYSTEGLYRISEELDDPGEYYIDKNTGTLYLYKTEETSSDIKLYYNYLTKKFFKCQPHTILHQLEYNQYL